MKVLDAIAHIMKKEGVEYLSAYPTTALIESTAEVGIRPIICRQERVGVGIADGYARVNNGTPPGCVRHAEWARCRKRLRGRCHRLLRCRAHVTTPTGSSLQRVMVYSLSSARYAAFQTSPSPLSSSAPLPRLARQCAGHLLGSRWGGLVPSWLRSPPTSRTQR